MKGNHIGIHCLVAAKYSSMKDSLKACVLTQFAKMKIVLYLTCGTGARDSGQYRSIMATYLNALMHFQRENIKVRKK